MLKILQITALFCVINKNDAARILGYYPVPCLSHQVVFRALTKELLKHGHELVVITPEPINPNGKFHQNLTEISVKNESAPIRAALIDLVAEMKGSRDIVYPILYSLKHLVEIQLTAAHVKSFLQDKTQKFDLLFVENFVEPAMGLLHLYDVPMIRISSMGLCPKSLAVIGAPGHAILFPTPVNQRVFKLTDWEKIYETYNVYKYKRAYLNLDGVNNEMLQRVFGNDVPSLDELRRRVDLTFINVYPLWDLNRPVPPSVVYVGGLHLKEEEPLPLDLKEYMDSSKNGVIYVSFGTNVDFKSFYPEKLQTFLNVFAAMSYDVLWKWDRDVMEGQSANIKISKWLPQSDLLRHPKLKLFITHGGLQSSIEAIDAAVPMIGVPIFGDQFYNVERIVDFNIGLHVDVTTCNEQSLNTTIYRVLSNDSYRENVKKLRKLLFDQPQTSLERAIWWTEYILRNGGSNLTSRSANLTFTEYYELKLIITCLLLLVLLVTLCVVLAYFVCRAMTKKNRKQKMF